MVEYVLAFSLRSYRLITALHSILLLQSEQTGTGVRPYPC